MGYISNRTKIKMLKGSRNHLIRQIKKGIDLKRELSVVCERLKHYRMLDEEERKIKKLLDKKK